MLYRHKRSPFWQYDFQIRGHKFSGSTRTADEHEASAFESRKKEEAKRIIDAAVRADREPLTIERACARWWAEHGQHLNDPDLKARLDWLVAQIGPRTALHSITNDTVSKVVQERRLDVRKAGSDDKGKQLYRPITARTVNKTTVSLLRRVLRRARDNWSALLPNEPTWKVHWLKEIRQPIRELSAREETVLDDIEDADFADLRRFAIITGLRRGNLLVTKAQVDFDNAIIRVMTKGGVPRIIPLSKEAYQILWRRQNHHETHFFTFVAQRTWKRHPKNGQPRIKGERYPITYYGMGSNKRKWIKAGVDARIHDLRHTTGSRIVRKTGSLKAAQILLGHSDIKTTANFYANVTVDDVRAAMDATDAATPRALPAPAKKQEGEHD